MPPTDVPPPKQFLHVTPVLRDCIKRHEEAPPPQFWGASGQNKEVSGFLWFPRIGVRGLPIQSLITRDIAQTAQYYETMLGFAEVFNYGMKEFHVEDCNGYRLAFGQEI